MIFDSVMGPTIFIVTGAILIGLSGMMPLLTRKAGYTLAAISSAIGAATGLVASIYILVNGGTETYTALWSLPFGSCDISSDPLSAVFLIPVFLVTGSASIYLRGYIIGHEGAAARASVFFTGLLGSSMAFLLLARNMVFFLIMWEIMALSAYFLLATDHHNEDVRRAGMIYLVATHTGTLFLFIMFFILQGMTSSFGFPSQLSLQAGGITVATVFIASCIGFGMKAGIMPLHIWLPGAHANAPSHASAMMSAVMLKMGIYGIIRTVSFFSHVPAWWGWVLFVAGLVSAVLGISFALGQGDFKRLLAYSSIENIGIISLALGVSFLGLSTGNQPLFIVGMAAALFHVLNHSMFKSLLFLVAGSVLHAVGTRKLDLLGGLSRRMPVTALFSFIGLVALSGLPPMNGFASEFLLYLGLFDNIRTGGATAVLYSAVAAGSLALVGGLAVIVFVRLYSSAFSGAARSQAAEVAHESPLPMTVTIMFLGLLCVAVGFAPFLPVTLLPPVLETWAPAFGSWRGFTVGAPLHYLSLINLSLLAVAVVLYLIVRRQIKIGSSSETWGCGYLRPTARIQYTASSFSEMIVKIFSGIINPRYAPPKVTGIFPASSAFQSSIPETQLERVLFPFFATVRERFSSFRKLQHGQLHIYIMYIFLVLITLLLWEHL